MSFTVVTTAEQFAALTTNPKAPALIMFGSPGCPYCVKGKPILREFATKYPRMAVAFVDVDRYEVLAGTFRISNLPTYIVFAEGKRKKRASGMHEFDDLVDLLEKALK